MLLVFNRKKLLPIYVFQGMIMFKKLIKPVMLDCFKTNEVPGTFFSYYKASNTAIMICI